MTNPVNRELSAFDEFIAAWLGPAAQRYVCDYRDCLCPPCELGMHSLAATLNPPWSRAMTSREVKLAHTWALIERGG